MHHLVGDARVRVPLIRIHNAIRRVQSHQYGTVHDYRYSLVRQIAEYGENVLRHLQVGRYAQPRPESVRDLVATVEGGPLGRIVLLVLGTRQHLADAVSSE